MNVIYRDILSELHAAIEVAMIHNRVIEYIELERCEWNEFRKAMLKLDPGFGLHIPEGHVSDSTDWKYEGIDIRQKEVNDGTYL